MTTDDPLTERWPVFLTFDQWTLATLVQDELVNGEERLQAIDSDLIGQPVEYFENYAEYLVVALLPEDVQTLGDDVN